MESDKLVKGESIAYEGLVDVKGFINMVDSWLLDKGYDKQDVQTEEKVMEAGKKIFIRKWPYKKLSDYAKSSFDLYIWVTNMKEVEVEKNGGKKKLWHANVDVKLDGYLETDYENSWDSQPLYIFFRTIVDRFVHREYMNEWKISVRKDCADIMKEIRGYLNITAK